MKDLESILLIGSGPIVIGQACEFDYSGTQALKAPQGGGLRLILVNSNPATIMTDPEFADATYIEPLTPPLSPGSSRRNGPTHSCQRSGGQTALNLAIELYGRRILDRFNVELIGASCDAINKAEDRDLFRLAMIKIGLEVLPRRSRSRWQIGLDERELGLPLRSSGPRARWAGPADRSRAP